MGNAQATKRRLLDTACAEFAAHGIAGARVDRIAAEARVNKAQMYAYFGSKEGLFDAVLAEQLDAILNAVPLAGENLPGYATRLYDEYLDRPEIVRLSTWARLERAPTGDLFGNIPGHDTDKLQTIADAQANGHIDPSLAPVDIHALVIAMAMTWSPASITYAAGKDEDPAIHDRRRHALAVSVRRAFNR